MIISSVSYRLQDLARSCTVGIEAMFNDSPTVVYDLLQEGNTRPRRYVTHAACPASNTSLASMHRCHGRLGSANDILELQSCY